MDQPINIPIYAQQQKHLVKVKESLWLQSKAVISFEADFFCIKGLEL